MRIFGTIVISAYALLAACAGPPTTMTLADTLKGGEWTCLWSPAHPEATATTYVSYSPDGSWRSRLIAEGTDTNGDRLRSEAVFRGVYTVEGNEIQDRPESVENWWVERNGTRQVYSAAEKVELERAMLALPDRRTGLKSWSSNKMVWAGEENTELTCVR